MTDRMEVIKTTHTLPAPFQPEDEIRRRVTEFRDEIVQRGGVVVSERRTRNIAFDKRGEKTTTVLVVKWR